MQALLLDGSYEGDPVSETAGTVFEGELREKGWEVRRLVLRDLDIAPCLGCFRCWTETPGLCDIDDEGRKVVEQFVHSDLAVFLSPVTFGGYSPELKKALDRFLPLFLPFFERKGGGVKHKQRYDNHPRLVALGVLPQADNAKEEIFRTLVGRNAGNFYSPAHSVGFVYPNQDADAVRNEIRMLLEKAEVGK